MIVIKGLAVGWKEKVFNFANLKYLPAGHGPAWKNEEDMDTQPMTAESVPQLLKLQLAVMREGFETEVRKKGKLLSKYTGEGKE